MRKPKFAVIIAFVTCFFLCIVAFCSCAKGTHPYAFKVHRTDVYSGSDSSTENFDSSGKPSSSEKSYFDNTIDKTKKVLYAGMSVPTFYSVSRYSTYVAYDIYKSFSNDTTFSFYAGTDNLYQISFGKSYVLDPKMHSEKQYYEFANSLLSAAIDYRTIMRKGCELTITSIYTDPATGILTRQNQFIEREDNAEITYIFSYIVYSNNVPTSDVTSVTINHRVDGNSVVLTFSNNPFDGVRIPKIDDERLLKTLQLAAESYPSEECQFIRSKSDRICWHMINGVPTLVCNIGVYDESGVRIASQEILIQPD